MIKYLKMGLLAMCMAIGMIASVGHAEKTADPTAEIIATTGEEPENPAFKLENLLQDRVLGNPEAPIEMVEFSSLSCPHCKTFHDDILGKIKKEYIDTGKVKLRFSDFPLNQAALQGSMVARCFPNDGVYFQYIEFLFETQPDWAFSETPLTYLRQNAKLLGLTDDDFNQCFNQEGYLDSFIKKIQEKGQKYQINSTPSFLFVQSGKIIKGNQGYEGFKQVIDEHLEQYSLSE